MASENVAKQRDTMLLRDDAAKLDGVAILPVANATTYSTRGIDISEFWSKAKDSMQADAELVILVGDMRGGIVSLANGDTLKISVLLDTDETIDGNSIVYMLDVLDFLGAAGDGDAGEEIRIKVPSVGFKVQIAGVMTQYDFIGVKCVHSGTGIPATPLGALPLNDGNCHCYVVF